MPVLNGPWVLATDSRNVGEAEGWFTRISPEAQVAPVPGIIQQAFPGYHGVAWYWHTFQPLTGLPPDERLLLHFGAVDYLAEVWLNGHYLGWPTVQPAASSFSARPMFWRTWSVTRPPTACW